MVFLFVITILYCRYFCNHHYFLTSLLIHNKPLFPACYDPSLAIKFFVLHLIFILGFVLDFFSLFIPLQPPPSSPSSNLQIPNNSYNAYYIVIFGVGNLTFKFHATFKHAPIFSKNNINS